MLGIIIGVASVITMLAIGQGSKRSIQQQISEMGLLPITYLQSSSLLGNAASASAADRT